ncbi:hypothetical protein GLW08_11875 [Pontibacillus yanchengensis]|uniref:Uncharacterized protein n=1 Tax=Pontibacillus yanchengensis TaxID=462910 RepID=A0ACC7VGH7_9BACI|nr:hypothetical protein [Pontibacillus yanchengensis]MYL54036.1 hypothetical protein [Pontibacillus yanchengensis]
MSTLIPFFAIGSIVLVIGIFKYREFKKEKVYSKRKQVTEMEKPSEDAYKKAEKGKSLGRGGGPF